MTRQKTILQEVEVTGVGLHSGRPARVILRPAPIGSGVIFRRADLAEQPKLPADFRLVHSTQLATSLKKGPASIATVEHLMAALQLLEVDNLFVDVFGAEVPILDGSAAPFVVAIQNAGVVAQEAQQKQLLVRRRIEFRFHEKWARIEPSSRLEIHGSIDFDHPSIGYQEFSYISGSTPISEIAGARTFGFLKEVELLHKAGLARGGSLENAVVVDDSGIMNPEGLRFSNEFARHKVLDALGDFKLAGIAIVGHFRLHRAGHDLHAKLLEELLRDPSNYEVVGDEDFPESLAAFCEKVFPWPRLVRLQASKLEIQAQSLYFK